MQWDVIVTGDLVDVMTEDAGLPRASLWRGLWT